MSTAPHALRPMSSSGRRRQPAAPAPTSGSVSAETARRVRRARTTAARVELVVGEPRVMEIMQTRAAMALGAPRANAQRRRVPLGAEMVPEVIQEAVIDAMSLAERRGYRTAHDIAGALIGCVQGAAERLCELAARARLEEPTDAIDQLPAGPARDGGGSPLALVEVLIDERHEAARRAEVLARLSPTDRRLLELAADTRLTRVQRAAAAGLTVRTYRDRVNYLRASVEADLERVRSGVYCQQARRLFPRMMRPGQLEAAIGERLAGRVRLHLAHCPTCSLERRRRSVGLRSWVPWPLLGWFADRWADTKEWAVRVSGIYTPSPGMTTEKAIAGAGGAAGGAAVKIALVAATAPVLVLGSLTVADHGGPSRQTPAPAVSAASPAIAPAPARRVSPTITKAAAKTTSSATASRGGGGLTGAADEFEPGGAPAQTTPSTSTAKAGVATSRPSRAAAEFAP
jgi:hypothetical protein